MLMLGQLVPDFDADTTIGRINWHDTLEGKWTLLASHPADFTPVCTTELGTLSSVKKEFDDRGIQIFALSCNDVESHMAWIEDINAAPWAKGAKLDYPIIADQDRAIALAYGMLDPEELCSEGLPMTCRAVFIIGPTKQLKLSILYPSTTGRNFDEILRVIDSLKLTAEKSLATPANWVPGDAAMAVPSLTDEEVTNNFGNFELVDVPSGKHYLRKVKVPK